MKLWCYKNQMRKYQTIMTSLIRCVVNRLHLKLVDPIISIFNQILVSDDPLCFSVFMMLFDVIVLIKKIHLVSQTSTKCNEGKNYFHLNFVVVRKPKVIFSLSKLIKFFPHINGLRWCLFKGQCHVIVTHFLNRKNALWAP